MGKQFENNLTATQSINETDIRHELANIPVALTYDTAPRFTPAETAILNQAERIIAAKFQYKPESMTSCSAVKTFLKAPLSPLKHEEFHVIFLDRAHQLIDAEVMSVGTVDSATVYPRDIAQRALANCASAVILGHNHPTGRTKLSEADKNITELIKKGLNLFEIKVLDHIIVGKAQTYSSVEHGQL